MRRQTARIEFGVDIRRAQPGFIAYSPTGLDFVHPARRTAAKRIEAGPRSGMNEDAWERPLTTLGVPQRPEEMS
jgi:hypothetical protein